MAFFFSVILINCPNCLWNCTNIGTSRDVPDVPPRPSVDTGVYNLYKVEGPGPLGGPRGPGPLRAVG